MVPCLWGFKTPPQPILSLPHASLSNLIIRKKKSPVTYPKPPAGPEQKSHQSPNLIRQNLRQRVLLATLRCRLSPPVKHERSHGSGSGHSEADTRASPAVTRPRPRSVRGSPHGGDRGRCTSKFALMTAPQTSLCCCHKISKWHKTPGRTPARTHASRLGASVLPRSGWRIPETLAHSMKRCFVGII